ncbi:MAG: leucine-rich repeat domain-containing protein [Bacteroidaceae bacterium]|nr:leucine-rich repeat domain-containing protein [Bacteroidaceae bacterium]
MKHAYLTLFIAVLSLVTGTKVLAYDCEVNGIYYYRISATELEVANKVFSDQNRTAYSGAVTIPSTVTYNGKTFTVVSIGDYAFRDCSALTSVTIPNTVRDIKSFAFYNCTQISNINLPSSIVSIGPGAFEGCSAISEMMVPAGVPAIEPETFYGCSAMKTVVLPSSISSVGAEAFARCASLISIYCLAETAPQCEENPFDKVDRTWCTLYVTKGVPSYKSDAIWSEFFTEEIDASNIPLIGVAEK